MMPALGILGFMPVGISTRPILDRTWPFTPGITANRHRRPTIRSSPRFVHGLHPDAVSAAYIVAWLADVGPSFALHPPTVRAKSLIFVFRNLLNSIYGKIPTWWCPCLRSSSPVRLPHLESAPILIAPPSRMLQPTATSITAFAPSLASYLALELSHRSMSILTGFVFFSVGVALGSGGLTQTLSFQQMSSGLNETVVLGGSISPSATSPACLPVFYE
jgi:hypothetical protein